MALRFTEARRIVIEKVGAAVTASGPATETLDLQASNGRVLAQTVRADRAYPPFDRATRDGYAVRAADVASPPARLRLIGEVRAGEEFSGRVGEGQCVSIMTGAPAPAGADAVVMLEYTRAEGENVVLERVVKPRENVVPRGVEAASGDVLLRPGRRIGYAEIALLASVGCGTVELFRQPRVAVLPTGDEIVEVDRQPLPFQIRNSNGYSLVAQVSAAGGVAVALGIAPDEPVALRRLIEQGLDSGLLLLSGGVSMGKYDLVENVLRELDAEFYFDAVAIQPGRPLVFGRARGAFFFGLPGNPLSTMVCCQLFAAPAIAMLGGAEPPPLAFLRARLEKRVRHKPGLTRFLPAVMCPSPDGEPLVRLADWQGSGDIVSLNRGNCYMVLPEDREDLAEGEMVGVIPRW